MNQLKKLYIFDVDGTLININKLSNYLGNKVSNELNINNKPKISFTNLFSSFNDCSKFFKNPNPYIIYDKHLCYYLDNNNDSFSEIYNDVIPFLNYIKNDKRNDIIFLSNRTRIKDYIDKYYSELNSYSNIIITAEPRKPNSNCLIPFLDYNYNEIIKIGDSITDKEFIINAKTNFSNYPINFKYYLVRGEINSIEYNDKYQVFNFDNLKKFI